MSEIVKVLELVSGEKVVGLVEETKTKYLLKNAFVILPTQKQGDFMFMPWPFFKDERQDTFEIRVDAVVVAYSPLESLIQKYTDAETRFSNKGSSLILPNSPKLHIIQ